MAGNLLQQVPTDLSAASSVLGGGQIPEPYAVEPTNWYKSLPYGFAFWDISATASDKAKSTMYLPISPNNLSITTSFATNVITTLYGVIEEHSEVRYYDITISGTTGFAPRFVAPFGSGTPLSASQSTGRSAFSAGGVPDLGGFLPEVTNTINQVLDVVNDIQDTLNGGPSNPTGIDPTKSGYVAFHNLYKFFLKYKNDAAQVQAAQAASPLPFNIGLPNLAGGPKRKLHPIQFLNYKDGVKYDCVPLSFTMTRSAEKPMEYNYVIRLRGYNLQNVNAKAPEADQLAKLGLGGLDGQSLFSSMTSIAGGAATVISGLF
jgi:hypothetical protein